ncbi:uncharacterized protein [Mytilus edulis]|uniref:uncharacterized protein n=1 Tax=Mytilus edulis TaxID=6550 RepID=UPI0039F0154B
MQWQSFWDSYETSVHESTTLRNVQKFNYLKSLLHDEALKTVTGFALTHANYEKAISLLQERYGQSHVIRQKYMQALVDIPAPKYTISSMKNYYDEIEIHIRGLESLGQSEDTYGAFLVPIIMNKLPGEIRRNLARQYRSTDLQLNELRRGIFDELYIMDAGKTSEQLEHPTATAAFLTNTNYSNRNRGDITVGTIQHNAEEPDTVLHSQSTDRVLLKTAINPVSAEHEILDAKILFDEGAQRSFITEELAEKLKLKPTGTESVNLSGFGDNANSTKIRHLSTGLVYLITTEGKLPIRVLIVPEIAVPMRTYVRQAAKLTYLSGIELAHPVTADENFEISILIGADYFWSIVQNDIIRGEGPTAVQSKIGYLLSGTLHSHNSDTDGYKRA